MEDYGTYATAFSMHRWTFAKQFVLRDFSPWVCDDVTRCPRTVPSNWLLQPDGGRPCVHPKTGMCELCSSTLDFFCFLGYTGLPGHLKGVCLNFQLEVSPAPNAFPSAFSLTLHSAQKSVRFPWSALSTAGSYQSVIFYSTVWFYFLCVAYHYLKCISFFL